jgi:4-amino-4-deoxy-L-arabinose transferase-like glycosyltransferase
MVDRFGLSEDDRPPTTDDSSQARPAATDPQRLGTRNHQTSTRNSHYWRDPVIWFLVAAALVARIVYNLALHPDGHPPSSFVIDEREYFSAAHMLVEGRGFSFFDTALWVRPPLYVVALAGVMAVAGDGYLPSLIFQSLLSVLTLLPLGWLAWRAGNLRAARLTVALGLLYLPLTLFAGLLLSETLFVFLFAWAVAALIRAREELANGLTGRAWLWLVVSGLLLGLGVLTRATALAFVPLVALWLCLGYKQGEVGARRAVPVRRRLVAAATVVAVSLVCLLPWIARNYAAYKRFVLVDTTSGYNLWLGSVGVRDEPRLQADLLAIPNPADRQSFAYSQAFKNITADPLGFAGKGLKESLDLWRPLFSAEERQIGGYTLGRIPAWHLASLLLFDDLLYAVILVAAVAGLAFTPPHPLKSLVLLWAALWVIMSFVFFAVTRFRLPLVAMLLPFAGMGLDALLSRQRIIEQSKKTNLATRVAVAAALVGIVVLVLPAIDVGATTLGIQRWNDQAPYRNAEALLKAGQVDAAIEQYKEADQSISDTRYGLAAAYLQKGIPAQALAQLAANEPDDRVEPPIIRGEAARMQGDLATARSFFNARTLQVDAMQAENWAWDHLNPPLTSTIQLGSGLDLGYIRGFYAPEKDAQGKTFRWSSDTAEVRNLQPQASAGIDWSGWRPPGFTGASPVVSWHNIGGQQGPAKTFSLDNSPGWTTGEVGQQPAGDGSLLIQPVPFIGAGNDQRLLGVRIATIATQ